jgi:TonB-dependent receptor
MPFPHIPAKSTRLLAVLMALLLPALHGASAAVWAATPTAGAAVASTISGTVKDTSGAVVRGARITLLPGGASTVTDAEGAFSVRGLAPGTYKVTVSYVGFSDFVSTVTVASGEAATLNAALAVGGSSQQIDVSGALTGDIAAINEQRTSENILNVQTDVQIQSLPNANIADALGRMPGVTLQRNEGEGQYVQIRGTEPRLSNTTIDGVIVPGPDPQVRQVDLDTIPADLVGSVAINKTLSANQDGDAIGGSVDLRIKQATSDRPTLMISGTGGNTPIDNQRQVYTIASSAGFRFGPRNDGGTKKAGLELGYSYDSNQRGIDDVEPTPDLDPSGNGNTYFDGENIQEYLYDRTRYGVAGALDYKLSEDSNLYAHGLFSNFRDYGQKYAYKLNGSNAKFSTSVRRPNLQIEMLALGGDHVSTHSFLKYQVAVAHSRFGGAAGNPGADFKPVKHSGLGNLQTCSYSAAASPSIYRPVFTGCTTPGSSIYDPTQYQLSAINLTSGQATQLNLQASASMGINYHLFGRNATLEFGGQFRNEHKGQDAYSPTYDEGDTPLMSQFLSDFTNPKFYGGTYQLGPVTNFDLITSYLAANPGAQPLDVAATHQASDAANYNLQERVSAGYIMNTITFGKFHLQTGLRLEATNTSNTGYLVTTNADGSYGGTTPQYASGSYVNPLPSVQLRYAIDSSSDIRAVYGRGISRPDPYQLVPYNNFGVGGGFSGDDLLAVGNPALVAEHANDYDLLYERFLPSVGVIQAGFFYKQITNPIYTTTAILAPGTSSLVPSPYAGDTVQLQQEVNGDHAYVSGVEVAYQQHLKFLPGYLGNARIDGNFTYTTSKNYNLTNRTDSPQLVGQAPYSWNIGPSYATKRALVSVGISHNSSNIYAYQYQSTGPNAVAYGVTGPNGDNYFYSHTQIDAQATYYVGKGFTLLASGENMNNEVFGFFNGSPQYMVQREYYKPTYSGGLRWNLRRAQ